MFRRVGRLFWHTLIYGRINRRTPRYSHAVSSRLRALAGFESATPYDLVLLSLGIEPRTIAELSQLDGMAEEDAEELHLGRQQEEFRRRLATLENHRLNGTIATESNRTSDWTASHPD